jgi:oligopeptide/dipeptide ABC transporter ATP-binding protein
MSAPLQATDLVRVYPGGRSGNDAKTALDGVSLKLGEGTCLGIVGESGCGKSTLARLLIGLEPPTSGRVELYGQPLDARGRQQRARLIQLVSQDPFSSLNPRLSAGSAITEVLRVHRRAPGRAAAADRVAELLGMVSLEPRFATRLPHELSGGQAQRVAIARALAAEPKILILDEPTSALDVSVRAGVINLLARLRSELGLSYLFISHDMAMIRQLSDSVGVMYQGRFVETGPWQDVLSSPRHPYTQALIDAVPEPDPDGTLLADETGGPAEAGLPAGRSGAPADPGPPGAGCAYYPRCPVRIARCVTEDPALRQVAPGQQAACHVAGPGPAADRAIAESADGAR